MIKTDSVWAFQRRAQGRADYVEEAAQAIERGAGGGARVSISPGSWPNCLELRAEFAGATLHMTVGRDNPPFAWFAASIGWGNFRGITALHGVSQGMNRGKGTLAPVWEVESEPQRFLESLETLARWIASGEAFEPAWRG